jgi:hypothetical protein
MKLQIVLLSPSFLCFLLGSNISQSAVFSNILSPCSSLNILKPTGYVIAQWLRYCATNQKVAGSIPDGVLEFFIDIIHSDRTMALGSTQPLTEMSTRSISWG